MPAFPPLAPGRPGGNNGHVRKLPSLHLAAALAGLLAALAGCDTTSMMPTYSAGEYEAEQDIAHHRFQLLTAEPARYIVRDEQTGLPVRPVVREDTRSGRAWVEGYNRRMTQWVADHGRPGVNNAPGVPSEANQLRISEAMNDPQRWLRLEGEQGLVDLDNGWLLRYRLRDDGQYLVWLRSGPLELDAQVTTPTVLPLADGRLVLVQPDEESAGGRSHAVLLDPNAPQYPFKLES